MTAVVIALLIIWIIAIQLKLNELSDNIKELRNYVLGYKTRKIESLKQSEKLKSQKETVNTPEVSTAVFESDEKTEFTEPDEKLPNYIENNLKKDEKSKSFENIFLGNVFNKIGALAILIGLIILIKIVSPYFVFTPELKITLAYLAGILMTFAALKLHQKENMKNYSEVLLGTGFGAMFISTYCASALFKLFNLPVTMIVATGLLLAAFFLADKLKTVSMLVISLIAAYINPLFLNSEFSVSSNFMLGYFIFINFLSVIYTYRNKSRDIINPVNLSITFLFALIYCNKINIAGPVILWALYLVYDLITGKTSRDNKVLNYLNIAVLSGILIRAFDIQYAGYTELVCASVYSLITYLKHTDKEVFKNYLQLSLIAAFLFVYFIFNDIPAAKCYIWTIEAVILSYFAYRFKFKTLAAWAVGVWAAAYCSVLPVDGVFAVKDITKFVPIWNIRLAMFAPVIIASAMSYFFLSKADEERFSKLAKFFHFVCLTSVYLYAGLELNNIITKYFIDTNTSVRFINNMTNSILGFVYTINLKRLQKTVSNDVSAISIIALLAGVVSLLLLLIQGVHYRPVSAFIPVINIRTAAFLAGVAAAVLYSKWTNKQIFKYIAVILGFILVHYEITDTILKHSINQGSYLVSVCWIIYSGIITTIGILKNKNYLKNSGIGLCILSIIRIFLYDLANIDILYKFIAILTLGIILMIISYLYNRSSNGTKY